MANVKILLVGNEKEAVDIKRTLESFDYEVPFVASSGEEAVEKALEIKPDLVLMDIIHEGDTDYVEAASKIKELDIPVIFLTSHADESMVRRATANQPYGYLVKPYDKTELKIAIVLALYKKKEEYEFKWSEDHLKMGMDMAKLVYWEYDTENDMFTFDDQFYSLYGTSAEQEGGIKMSAMEYATRFVPPEEQAAVGVEVAKAIETDDPDFSSSMQHWIIRADGERRYIIVRIRARLDENGRKIGTRGVNQDITELKMAEEALKEADQRLADIIDFLPDPTFAIDKNGKVISWNRAIEEMTRVWSEGMLGKGNYEYSIPFYGKRQPTLIDMLNASEEEINKRYKNLKRSGKVLTAETEVSLRGDVRTVWIKVGPLEDREGNLVGAIETIRDITDLRKAEDDLQNTKEELERIIQSSPAAIIVLDFDCRVRRWSPSAEKIFGWTEKEVIGKLCPTVPPEYVDEILSKEFKLLRKGKETIYHPLFKPFEVIAFRKDGSEVYMSLSVAPLYGASGEPEAVINVMVDLTERKEFEAKLKKSLEEKEMLVKEIHHRVKNNLMIISSLLNLQSHYIKDKEALDVFKESENRAKSMAMIHERLYKSTDLKKIDFGDYIRSLTIDLYRSMVADPGRVKLDIDVEDLKIDINTVVPLGLIVNELVTNSMKYAFPDNKSGHIQVQLYRENEKIVLKVHDNGIGFPEDLDYKTATSLGLELVNSLTTQIEGELKLDRSQGTTFTIIFQEQKES